MMIAAFVLVLCSSAHSEQSPKQTDAPVKKEQVGSAHKDTEAKAASNRTSKLTPVALGVIAEPNRPVESCSQKCGESKPDKDWWHEFRTDPIATFTGFLFLATVLLWWATRNLVKGAERTSERQLRAYLHVKQAQASRDSEGVLWAKVHIQNYGQTPAYDVVQWIGIVGVSDGDIPNTANP